MPHRTRRWVWAGRATALAAVIGLAGYLFEAGLSKAVELAAPVGVVVALAALVAPYLLPVYQSPATAQEPPTAGPVVPGVGDVVIIADHGGVAAQTIGEVTMNGPWPDPGA